MTRLSRWRRAGVLPAAFAVVAIVFVLIGLSAIAFDGWRDPYADQWRLYAFYLGLPFPDSVLQLENGHRPILPGLVRMAEIAWLHGGQGLQLTIGALAALLTVLLLAAIARTDRTIDAGTRWLAVAVIAAAVFWLGNGRFLLHGNESVHGYLLTASLAAALTLVLGRAAGDRRSLIIAALLAMAASFCFGPGIAAFPALAIVLTLQGRQRDVAIVVVALAATLLFYFVLPDAGGVRGVLTIEPWSNLRIGAAWLASLWVHLLQPFLDVEAARALPGWLASATAPIAAGYERAFGDIWTQHAPATALGLIAIAYLAGATWSTWRSTRVSPLLRAEAGPGERAYLRLCGLGLGWFALGVAALVAVSRLSYFQAHPDQAMAQRYLPWSSLFWLGVLLTALAAPIRTRIGRLVPRAISLVFLLGALASTPAYRAWAIRIQDGLALQAAGIAVGVLAHEQPLWETRFEEVEAMRPLLRARALAMFAWPETHMLVARRPATVAAVTFDDAQLTTESIANRFGDDGVLLRAHVADTGASARMPRRLLVIDESRYPVGMLVRQRSAGAGRYAGYAPTAIDERARRSWRVVALSE